MKKRKSIIKKIRRTMTKYFPYFVKKKKINLQRKGAHKITSRINTRKPHISTL